MSSSGGQHARPSLLLRSGIAVAAALATALMAAGTAGAQSGSVNLDRAWPAVRAEGKIWIGTPGGLVRYSEDDDAFKRLALAGPEQFAGVRDLQYDDGWLWCITDSGLAALNIRLSEWLYFDRSRGLPSGRVNALAATDDYLWAATDGGAARFDRVIEQWETIGDGHLTDSRMSDVLVTSERVWFVAEHGLAEYDADFEKWRHHRVSEDSTVTVRRAFVFGAEIWLVTDRGLIRFSPELETGQSFFEPYLSAGTLVDLLLSDDEMWAVTATALHYYAASSKAWRDFEENPYLAGTAVTGACLSGRDLWVLTDRGVRVWDRASGRWTALDYASGLSRDVFDAVYVSGESAFLLEADGTDYRRTSSEKWRRLDLAEPSGGRVTAPVARLLADLLDNQEGGGIEVGPRRLGLEGTRVSLSDERRRSYASWADGRWSTASAHRLDLKGLLALGEGRGLAGFYNDTDYGRTLYGLHYRADNRDLLHDAAWGDLRHEPGEAPFGDQASLFGYSVWLQGGPRTERYKRSLVALKADAGARRSEAAFEHFTGQASGYRQKTPDRDYVRHLFALPGVPPDRPPDFLEIYLDDLQAATNDPNTLEGRVVAGIPGDFDLLRTGDDYRYDQRTGVLMDYGVLRFLEDYVLAARYAIGGVLIEEVLRSGGASTERRNVYRIPVGTVPSSFALSIVDTLGTAVPLAGFGLDGDADGLVDSQWVDYAGGFLVFPQDRPFPPEVYDPDAYHSVYRLDLSGETYRPVIYLAHGDLVRGLEVVSLDGLRATPGEDYVLDYTFGSLIFVREGLVSADTRIEIEYEYYVDEEREDVASAALAVNPSDALSIQVDWLGRRPGRAQPGGGGSTHLVSLHGEAQGRLAGLDLRVKPGLAYRADSSRIAATSLEALVSSARVRLQARHESFDEAYSGLAAPQSVIGEVERRTDFHSTADLTGDLRLGADWQQIDGRVSAGTGPQEDRTGSASLLFRRTGWPGWEMVYTDIATAYGGRTCGRRFVRSRFEYQMPDAVASRLALKSLRTEAQIRAGRDQDSGRPAAPERDFREGFVRLDAGLGDRFSTGLFYRRNSASGEVGGSHGLLTRSQKVTLSLSHERWRLLQASFYAENTLEELCHPAGPLVGASLEQRSQATARIAPGALAPELAFANFEAGFNLVRSAAGTTADADAAWVWRILGGRVRDLPDWNTTRTCYLRNDLRPSAAVSLSSKVEWSRVREDFVARSTGTAYWRWTENLDWSLDAANRLKAQYSFQDRDLGQARASQTHQPALSLESRWTPEAQTIVYLDYLHASETDGALDHPRRRWHARCDFTLNRKGVPGVRRAEIRPSLDWAWDRFTAPYDFSIHTLGAGASLDVYPVHSTILRLKADWTATWDSRYPETGYALRLETRAVFTF